MIDFPCVIFAGGKSSRMGEDKALLPFGNFTTLTQFQLHKLTKIFTNVYISCKNKGRFPFEAYFIEDTCNKSTYAPTAGFVSTFEYLKCEKFFALSVDTPFIDENTIVTLINSDKKNLDACVATLNSQIQPMCGIYHSSLQKSFLEMLENNNHKLGLLLKSSKTQYIDFNDSNEFLNLNSPQEYQQALKLI